MTLVSETERGCNNPDFLSAARERFWPPLCAEGHKEQALQRKDCVRLISSALWKEGESSIRDSLIQFPWTPERLFFYLTQHGILIKTWLPNSECLFHIMLQELKPHLTERLDFRWQLADLSVDPVPLCDVQILLRGIMHLVGCSQKWGCSLKMRQRIRIGLGVMICNMSFTLVEPGSR